MDVPDRERTGGKIDAMWPRRAERGRFVVNAKGEVAQVGALELPDGVVSAPSVPGVVLGDPPPIMGPTRIKEWLLVDIRAAKLVEPGSRLFRICQDLAERSYCGVVEATLVIDLLEMRKVDREFVLNRANWPDPKKRS